MATAAAAAPTLDPEMFGELGELAPLAQKASGMAFGVQIKKVGSPPGRAAARLLSYTAPVTPNGSGGEGIQKPLPMLLRATAEGRMPAGQPRRPSDDLAAKARAENERKRAAAQRAQKEQEVQANSIREGLEDGLEKAAKKRDGSLEVRSAKAGRHCQEVQEKAATALEIRATHAAEQQKRLEVTLLTSSAAREANLTEVRAKACHHNEAVAARLRQHQQSQGEARQKLVALDSPSSTTTPPPTPTTRGKASVTGSEQLSPAPVSPHPASRGTRARRHNEGVARKAGEPRRSASDQLAELRDKLAQQAVVPPSPSGMSARSDQARRHNELVATKCGEQRLKLSGQTRSLEEKFDKAVDASSLAAQRWQKARTHNEAVSRTRSEQRESALSKARELRQKVETPPPSPSDARGRKARDHNRQVTQRASEHSIAMSDRAAELRQKIADEMCRTTAATSRVLLRSEKALRHNDDVSRKDAETKSALRERVDRLRQRLDISAPPPSPAPSAAARSQRARLHNDAVARKRLEHEQARASRRCRLVARLSAALPAARAPPSALLKKCAGAQPFSAVRCAKARRHNDAVARRCGLGAALLASQLAELRLRLGRREAVLAEGQRVAVERVMVKARRHNEKVARRLAERGVGAASSWLVEVGPGAKAAAATAAAGRRSAAVVEARRSRAKSHNEIVSQRCAKRRGELADKALALARRLAAPNSASLVPAAIVASRVARARRHNEAVAERGHEAERAKLRRIHEIQRALEKKGLADANKGAPTAELSPASPASLESPAGAWARLSAWLASALPCGTRR